MEITTPSTPILVPTNSCAAPPQSSCSLSPPSPPTMTHYSSPKLSQKHRGKTSPNLAHTPLPFVQINGQVVPNNQKRRATSHDSRNEKAALAFLSHDYFISESIPSPLSASTNSQPTSPSGLHQTHPPIHRSPAPISLSILPAGSRIIDKAQEELRPKRVRSSSFGPRSSGDSGDFNNSSLLSSIKTTEFNSPFSIQFPQAVPYPFEQELVDNTKHSSPTTIKGLISSMRDLFVKKEKKEMETESDKDDLTINGTDDEKLSPRNLKSAFSRISSRAPEHLLAEVHKTLTSMDIAFQHLSPFCLRCNLPLDPSVDGTKEEPLSFEVEVCRIPGQTATYYLRAKLIHGSCNTFNVVYNRLFQRLQIGRGNFHRLE